MQYETHSRDINDDEDEILYIFMELCALDMFNRVKMAGKDCPWQPGEKLRNIEAMCKNVAVLHNESISHRDIRPHNVLVSDRGEAELSDFGLS